MQRAWGPCQPGLLRTHCLPDTARAAHCGHSLCQHLREEASRLPLRGGGSSATRRSRWLERLVSLRPARDARLSRLACALPRLSLKARRCCTASLGLSGPAQHGSGLKLRGGALSLPRARRAVGPARPAGRWLAGGGRPAERVTAAFGGAPGSASGAAGSSSCAAANREPGLLLCIGLRLSHTAWAPQPGVLAE